MDLLKEISVQFIKGVGPARKKLFKNMGVETVEDLLYLFPRRYEDRTKMTPIAQLVVGELQTISGKVMTRGGRRVWYTKKHLFEIVIDDGTGKIFAVWFNQPYLSNYFKPDRRVVLYGKVDLYKKRLQMISPEYEILEDDKEETLNTSRIVPVYPLTRGMTQRYLRRVVRGCLDRYGRQVRDILPVWLRNKHRLVNIQRSLENIHFPESQELQEQSQRRVSFEEFFIFQLSVIKRRMSIVHKPGVNHRVELDTFQQFESAFPFELTAAQKRVIRELGRDMQEPRPMLRLLQGDVGSGKTLVALFGCIVAFKNNKQAAIMAPTEILAQQHFEKIQNLLADGPFADLKITLLIGSVSKQKKELVLHNLKQGEIDLIVGTHALLSEMVDFKDLSFVVIDEQHKFGVRQRALLSDKGRNPDVLVMTATPIPRTLSLTLFGDLDVSILDEMPKDRGKVRTEHYGIDEEAEVFEKVRNLVGLGQQAYIIYPLVEESEKLDLKAAQTSFQQLKKGAFKGIPMGLVHGQMKREQAEQVMEKFKNGEIKILVATTVLEVGIDVANANVMVIEHAERFGLAQLHQLRGRIGRGKEDASCFLIADPQTVEAQLRMETIVALTDGFKLAEQDLLIRGPGHYFGRHQHGLNELRFANPLTQIDILELARDEAKEVIYHDPNLKTEKNQGLKQVIKERFPTYLANIEAG